MNRTAICIASLAAVLALSACNRPEPRARDDEPQGREETRTIRNTEAIGYAGDAIADKVDKALDENDQAKQKMDDELDKQFE